MFYTLSIGFIIIILLLSLPIDIYSLRAQAISPSHHQNLLRFTIACIYTFAYYNVFARAKL